MIIDDNDYHYESFYEDIIKEWRKVAKITSIKLGVYIHVKTNNSVDYRFDEIWFEANGKKYEGILELEETIKREKKLKAFK